MDSSSHRWFTSALLLLTLLTCDPERVEAQIWTGNVSDHFSEVGDWNANAVPVGGHFLRFNSAGPSGLLLNNDLTDGSFSVGLRFSAGAGSYVIGHGTPATNSGRLSRPTVCCRSIGAG